MNRYFSAVCYVYAALAGVLLFPVGDGVGTGA